MMVQRWQTLTTLHVLSSRLVNSSVWNTNLYTSLLRRHHVSLVSGSSLRPRFPHISRHHTIATSLKGLDDRKSDAQRRAQELESMLIVSMRILKIAKSHNLYDWKGAAHILHNLLPKVEKFCQDSSTNNYVPSRHTRELAIVADEVQSLLTSRFATAGGPQSAQGLVVSLLSAMRDNDILHEGKLAPLPPSPRSTTVARFRC